MVKQSSDSAARTGIVNQLVQDIGQGIGSASIRATLEKVSADDPDVQLRQIAANALRSTGPAKASLSAGLAAALGRLKQIPDPALKANMIGQLRQYSGNPNLCAELERISSSDPDPQVREIAADLLK